MDIGRARDLKKLNKAGRKKVTPANFCDTGGVVVPQSGNCIPNTTGDVEPSCGAGNTIDVTNLPRGPCIDDVKQLPSGPSDAEAEDINEGPQCSWSQQPQLPSFEGDDFGDEGDNVGDTEKSPAGDGLVENSEIESSERAGDGVEHGEFSTQGDKPATVEEIIENETLLFKKTRWATQFDKSGTSETAYQDYCRTRPIHIQDLTGVQAGGKIGRLIDGRIIIYRPQSSEGRPTLEVQYITPSGVTKYLKIRYGVK